jgi:putative spermidine/putrescine transport system substrate-binding protein
MNRRELMISASALAAGATVLPRLAVAQGNSTIQWVTSSDQNIIDFWTNVVKPKFEAANPGLTVNLVDGGDMSGLIALASRGLAALQTHKDPQFDFLEGFDTRLPDGGLKAGLWTDFSKANLSNYSKINPLALDIPTNFPYRGSQVLLAYDGTKIDKAKAPTTWADLVAWIKANPGQFIYNRPDKGGSGANFVIRAIYEANGKDPSLFKVDNYDKAKADEMLAKGFALLKDLEPYLMGKGQYTSGNTQSIQLLSQSAVAMIPAWSDQSLSALNQGVLPDTTGLVQLADLGFPGGFTWCAVPTNDANHDAALKLCDFLLTEEVQSAILTELGGFPGVSWDHVSDDLRKKFEAIVPKSIPVFPQGDWTKAVNDGWYRNVATNLTQGA